MVALIIKDILKTGAKVFDEASPFNITVDAKYLSKEYQIPVLRSVLAEGRFLEVSKVVETLTFVEKKLFEEHVIGKEARFRVSPGWLTRHDTLYLDNVTWNILRDVGIFPNEYELKVRIERIEVFDPVTKEKQVTKVYPYADVEAR